MNDPSRKQSRTIGVWRVSDGGEAEIALLAVCFFCHNDSFFRQNQMLYALYRIKKIKGFEPKESRHLVCGGCCCFDFLIVWKNSTIEPSKGESRRRISLGVVLLVTSLSYTAACYVGGKRSNDGKPKTRTQEQKNKNHANQRKQWKYLSPAPPPAPPSSLSLPGTQGDIWKYLEHQR